MPAIFHNSTAADSSTNTAARPASASPRRPPPRAPRPGPGLAGRACRPRTPGPPPVPCRPPSVRPPSPCPSPTPWSLSSAVRLSSAQPQVTGLPALPLGPLPHLSLSLLNTPLLSISLTPTPIPPGPRPGCLPHSALLSACVVVCLACPIPCQPPSSTFQGVGEGRGGCLLPSCPHVCLP